MYLSGVSGAGVARMHSPGPLSNRSSRTSTPHSSMMSIPAGMSNVVGDQGDMEHREPVAEGNLKISQIVECPSEIMCCTYNEDSTLLAVGFVDGSIRVYSAENGAPLHTLTDDETLAQHLPCTSVVFRPFHQGDRSQNLILATYANGLVKLWHASSQKCVHTIHENRQTLTAAFPKNGSVFITAGSDEKIYVYDTSTKKLVNTCQPSPSRNVMDGHRYRVFSVKFHHNHANEFISGGWDDTVHFWDSRSEHSTRKLFGPHVCGDSLDIDAHHNHIVTGSWRKDANLQIWDYESGEEIRTVPQDFSNSLLYCAQWLGKDHIIVGGCDANMVRVIDRGTLKTTGRLVDLPRGVYCLDNNRQGNVPKFVAGSSRNLYFLEMKQTY
ncbi:uncharacterized protein [Amphiura filiformis]|uniref:uncharacterized protein n=1 Tax=Amphiura filiformis TaxID=82378 RepID=UPI003B21F01B